MAVILLVEDNPHITKFNSVELAAQGHEVLEAETLKKARELLIFHPVDLIVLDIMMPDGSGIDFCREYRKNHQVPVIFLTALGAGADIVEGLRAGGDDYLTKPYDIEEFLARVEAQLRRNVNTRAELELGGLVLDTVSLRGLLFGKDMYLTAKEYSVLSALMRSAGRFVPRDELYTMIWGPPVQEDTQALRTTVSRLKKKLLPEESGIELTYEREQGYCLTKRQLSRAE
jgi:DNA-binding response OmpR family regulator